MKRIIVCMFILMFPVAAFGQVKKQEKKQEKKPFSVLGVTLGESKSSVMEKFKKAKVEMEDIGEESYLFYGSLQDDTCTFVVAEFFSDKLSMFTCSIDKAQDTYKIGTYFELLERLETKYGEYEDLSEIPNSVLNSEDELDMEVLKSCFEDGTIKLAASWDIDGTNIIMTLVPNDNREADDTDYTLPVSIYYIDNALHDKYEEKYKKEEAF